MVQLQASHRPWKPLNSLEFFRGSLRQMSENALQMENVEPSSLIVLDSVHRCSFMTLKWNMRPAQSPPLFFNISLSWSQAVSCTLPAVGQQNIVSRHISSILALRPSWISAHLLALTFLIIFSFEFLIHKNLSVDTKMNILGAFLWKLWAIVDFSGVPGSHFEFLLPVTLGLTLKKSTLVIFIATWLQYMNVKSNSLPLSLYTWSYDRARSNLISHDMEMCRWLFQGFTEIHNGNHESTSIFLWAP